MSEKTTHVYCNAEWDGTQLAIPNYVSGFGGSSFLVIDNIFMYTDPGATGGACTISVLANDASSTLFVAGQYFDASTPDTINIPFPSGLPCWRQPTTGNTFHGPGGANSFIQLNQLPGAATSAALTVLYHYEPIAKRTA